MNIVEWLGENNRLGIDIWKKKYQNNNESFDSWLDRVSGNNQDIKKLIVEKKFLFAGRILANRGVDRKGLTYSNCYVLDVHDSIESIFNTCAKMARTYSYGGGVGVDISTLRPNGAIVHNAAKFTSGAVSFMKTFSSVTEVIGQQGRRGALMCSIDVRHPDIEAFIDAKANTENITFANISVRVNDKFMQAVENDRDYLLRWPCDMELTEDDEKNILGMTQEYDRLYSDDGFHYFKKVKAKPLFEKLARNNWDYAEPGILYWDRISNWHLMSNNKEFKYGGTNPCVTGDTLIQTVEGEVPIKDLVGKHPYVYCMDSNGKLTIKQAIKVWKTRENASLIKVITGKGVLICTPNHKIYTTNRGYVEAELLRKGDKIKGLNRQTTGPKYCAVGLSGTCYEKEHRFVARHFYDVEDMDIHHINNDGFDNRLSNLAVISHEEHSMISNTGRTIEFNRDENTGRFLKKEIHKSKTCVNLGKDVGVNWFVQSVEHLDRREDVYDMEIEEVHNFIANGFVVHNCGEEPLPVGGACLLGAMNIESYVKDDYTFDFNSFANDVKIAVVGLNEVLDEGIEKHPLQIQKDIAKKYRQIGLGMFNLGGALIRMKMKYGDNESVRFASKLTHIMLVAAFEKSCDLNKEGIKYENMFDSKFYKEKIYPSIDKKYRWKYPRNSQLLTIAPTGTISTMINASSGGCEPVFMFEYYRTTKSLHGEDVTYKVYPQIVLDYFKDTEVDVTKLPDYFVCSENIKWADRVAMQAALNSNIDASISSTVNLPENTTVDDVYNLYMYAWKMGLKGITIFRNNCKRVAILSKTDKHEENTSQRRDAPKRPKQLDADFYLTKAYGEQFIVLIGLYEGKPYEIFTFRPKQPLNVQNHHGTITKKGKMHYSFDSEYLHIEDLQDANINMEENASTLYTSQLLRHGVPIKHIIHTAKKVNANIVSFSSAMCRILAKYMDTSTDNKEKCPECGKQSMINDGGCKHCENCGYSSCS